MSPLLAIILIVVAIGGLCALTSLFLWRWEERDIERRAMEWRREQTRLAAYRFRSTCAMRGHKYQTVATSVSIAGCVEWFCPVCGERINVLDLEGTA